MGVQLVVQDGTPYWWESPDIWVVPGNDPNGASGTPVAGNPAFLWARVTNQGNVDALQVQVDFWIANPSLQIRKSTANHIGTSFADVPAGTTQDVLCLVPWNVTIINGGHECAVVEASLASDPLNPAPADPDVLDAPTYRQIAQRNLSVAAMGGMARREMVIEVAAGARADQIFQIEATVAGDVSRELLQSLGLRARRAVSGNRLSVLLSESSQCGAAAPKGHERLEVRVARGTARAVYLNLLAREPMQPDEYSVARVVARDRDRVVGGVSVVVVDRPQEKGGVA